MSKNGLFIIISIIAITFSVLLCPYIQNEPMSMDMGMDNAINTTFDYHFSHIKALTLTLAPESILITILFLLFILEIAFFIPPTTEILLFKIKNQEKEKRKNKFFYNFFSLRSPPLNLFCISY
jgi:hypothetical protein